MSGLVGGVEESEDAYRQEIKRLRSVMWEVRCALHAHNRPQIGPNLRIELRDQLDAALSIDPIKGG